ncbi:MAG: transporter substrate-binding domain-containing protein [Treponema sp.]|jgi:ABC-type amino acid transport substrate-binding protein|nr:transporter substrate-binding domain-containing protein [Treponema sp.]
MQTKIFIFFVLFILTFPVFANGEQDPSAPFNDHEIVAVHRIHLREVVRIGVISDNKPFSYQDKEGVWQGYDVYFARRIAVEILGKKDKYLRMVPVTEENWVELLNNDKIDFVLGFGYSNGDKLADFSLPYRRIAGETVAVAVRKGNDGLILWLNDVISRRVENDFFHKDYEATLRQFYGTANPDSIVIERGVVKN